MRGARDVRRHPARERGDERGHALGRLPRERVEDRVDRLLRSGFAQRAPECFEVHGHADERTLSSRLLMPAIDAALEHGEQLVRFERLREIACHPTRETVLPLARQRVGGQGDDRQVLPVRQAADRRGRLDIHQYHVVGATPHRGDGFAAVVHGIHGVPALEEHGHRHLLVHEVVLREEDLQRAARLGDRMPRDEGRRARQR